jgi:hypothetical protein
MAGVAIRLGQEAVVDGVTLAIAVVAAGVLWRGKGSAAWLMAAGGAVGMVVRALR